MTLPAPMADRLAEPAAMMSYCLELQLPGRAIRLTDGGFYSFAVDGVDQLFTAEDEDFGVLAGVGPITDGVADEFPTTDIVINYRSNAALAALTAPEAQDSLARIWVLVLDPVTGQPVAAPQRWFKGRTNVPSLSLPEGTQFLTISLNSILAAAKQADEGVRLNDGFHQRAWPGEKGLEFSSSVEQVDYWGADTPKAAVDYAAAQLRMLSALGLRF